MKQQGRKNALVLSGGGARGAFQAGAIKAIAEIATKAGVEQPFPLVSGVSAGSINAAYYAAACHELKKAAPVLANFWGNLSSREIFRSDVRSIGKIGLTWGYDILFGGLLKKSRIKALLDTSPLRALLNEHLPVRAIRANLKNGVLEALEVSAINYATSDIVSFVASERDFAGWHRSKRHSEVSDISVEHVMASTAIPLFFPPVKIGKQFFGDGCLRNTTPLSPAIRLGARKLLIIGVRKQQLDQKERDAETVINPTIARILSVILNAILLDAMEFDLERLTRINRTLSLIDNSKQNETPLEPIDYVFVRPSEDIGEIAAAEFDRLPASIRYVLDGLGSNREASELISYLLFDSVYCQHLVDLGYKDTLKREDEIATLLTT